MDSSVTSQKMEKTLVKIAISHPSMVFSPFVYWVGPKKFGFATSSHDKTDTAQTVVSTCTSTEEPSSAFPQ